MDPRAEPQGRPVAMLFFGALAAVAISFISVSAYSQYVQHAIDDVATAQLPAAREARIELSVDPIPSSARSPAAKESSPASWRTWSTTR